MVTITSIVDTLSSWTPATPILDIDHVKDKMISVEERTQLIYKHRKYIVSIH